MSLNPRQERAAQLAKKYIQDHPASSPEDEDRIGREAAHVFADALYAEDFLELSDQSFQEVADWICLEQLKKI